MRNNILLIRPATVTGTTSFIAGQFPLNIAGMAACLLKKGYGVEIWDFEVEAFDEKVFTKRLEVFSPFLVGISCYTPTVMNAHAVAKAVKRVMPYVPVVAGGPHVSALPLETLAEFKQFDIGVIGEGEETIGELADRISTGKTFEDIAGIAYRRGQDMKITAKRRPIPDLDELPFPARQLLDMPRYKGQSHRGFSRSFLKITEIMTSRGCPNRCIFCASDVVMGPGVRFRSSDSVKDEIGECVEKYGFNHFAVTDDTFTLREDRLYDICEEFAGRKLTWNCLARVWPLSKKMLSVMASSGCTGITFGVESGSPRILGLIKKNITLQQIEDAFRWSREAGIKLVEADVIIGSHPSETMDDLNMTKSLLKKISPDIIMASIVVPYPGTKLYDIMKSDKLLLNDISWDSFILFGKEPLWRTDHFDPGQLVALQKSMLFNFYFRPRYIFGVFKKMRSLKEAAYWVRGGLDFLGTCVNNRETIARKQMTGE